MSTLQLRKLALPLLVGAAVLAFMFWLSTTGERVSEAAVRVAEVSAGQSGGALLAPREAVAGAGGKPYVLRAGKNLRAERVEVEVAGEAGGGLLRLRAAKLAPGDVLVLGPQSVAEGGAVAPVAGLPEERLVGLVLEGGMQAVASENLPESVRYVSPGYRDAWGYNIALLRALLKRTYKEFDGPRFELAAPPVIRVEGRHALVQADLRLSATYRGRRNWLLGDAAAPNRVMLRLDKAVYGWKLARIEGLRPLGFEERFFRLLGGEVGLPLSDAERQEKKQACSLCRQRMAERFGPAR
jgi:hypothetical protein